MSFEEDWLGKGEEQDLEGGEFWETWFCVAFFCFNRKDEISFSFEEKKLVRKEKLKALEKG